MSKAISLAPRWKRLGLPTTLAVLGALVHGPALASAPTTPLSIAAIGVMDGDCRQLADFAPAASGLPTDRIGASKSEAILGGTMSALDRIRAEQAGLQLSQQAPAAASLAAPSSASSARCASLALAVPPAVANALPPAIAEEPSADNFLATPRIAIRRTTFSSNWDRVSANHLSESRVAALIGSAGGDQGESDGTAQFQFVNRWVNQSITYGEDREVWASRDYWATAGETLSLRRGDCEDLAILKYQMLLALGVDPQDMYLTLARDLARNADHAVLIVRHGERFYLLDNSTDAILPANLSYDYRPTLSFNSQSAWLHGAVGRARPQWADASEQAAMPQPVAITTQDFRPALANIAELDLRATPITLADRRFIAVFPELAYLSVSARSSPRVIGFSK